MDLRPTFLGLLAVVGKLAVGWLAGSGALVDLQVCLEPISFSV